MSDTYDDIIHGVLDDVYGTTQQYVPGTGARVPETVIRDTPFFMLDEPNTGDEPPTVVNSVERQKWLDDVLYKQSLLDGMKISDPRYNPIWRDLMTQIMDT